MGHYFGGGSDGIVASLETRQQLTQVIDGRLQRRHILQDGEDVPAGVQHPTLVESLQTDNLMNPPLMTVMLHLDTFEIYALDAYLAFGGGGRHLPHVLLFFRVRGVLSQLVQDVGARGVSDIQVVCERCAVRGGAGERVFLVGFLCKNTRDLTFPIKAFLLKDQTAFSITELIKVSVKCRNAK